MSTQEPQCVMYRDGYDCDGKSEVLLVVYHDNTYDLYCRECLKLNNLNGIKVFTLGNQVTLT